MDELVVWLRVQLDEDEQTARKLHNLLARLQWVADRALGLQSAIEWNVPRADQARLMGSLPPEPDGLTWVEAEEMRGTALDPARVLREIDAKRQLLDVHRPLEQRSTGSGGGSVTGCQMCSHFPAQYPCATLRLLALPYADRPGYRDEWRP